ISRSLAKLNVVKVDGYYQLPAIETVQIESQSNVGAIRILSAGDNMLVVRTGPGSASRFAFIIDNAHIPGVVGTIAGDDTIFLAVSQKKLLRKILNQVHALVDL